MDAIESDNKILDTTLLRCFVCNGMFKSKPQFDEHQQLNTTEEPFKCIESGPSHVNSFTIKDENDLLKNSQINYPLSKDQETKNGVFSTMIKYFKCKICEKYSKSVNALLAHQRTHDSKQI